MIGLYSSTSPSFAHMKSRWFQPSYGTCRQTWLTIITKNVTELRYLTLTEAIKLGSCPAIFSTSTGVASQSLLPLRVWLDSSLVIRERES